MSNKQKEVDQRLDELEEIGKKTADAYDRRIDRLAGELERVSDNQYADHNRLKELEKFLSLPWYKRIFKTYKEKK